MIHIEKTPYPEFMDFVRRNNPQNWDVLDGTVRTNTRKYILEEEQGNQCAYTEMPLEYKNNNSHIEHLKRKDAAFFPELTFEWTNLFVSCISSDFGGKYKDQVYLKGKTKVNNALILNPALENPADFFDLKNWGEITIKGDLQGIEKTKAEETIKAFNLNHNSLIKERIRMMRAVQMYKEGGITAKEDILGFLANEGFKSVIAISLEN